MYKQLTPEVGTSILDTLHIIIPVTQNICHFLPKFLFHIPEGIIILIGLNSLWLLWNWGCQWKGFGHFKLIFVLFNTLRIQILLFTGNMKCIGDITYSLT
jgi:hypothetical protein